MSARDRILECARELFFSRSFSRVALKDIAEAAGVSAPLIIKHFQSKENLFAQTLDFSTSANALFSGPFECLGTTSVVETLSAPEDAPYSMVRVLMVADGSEGAIMAIRERVKRDLISVLTKRIEEEAPYPTPLPQLRAQSALSILVGLSFMRRVGDSDFEIFSRAELIRQYSATIQSVIDGTPPEKEG